VVAAGVGVMEVDAPMRRAQATRLPWYLAGGRLIIMTLWSHGDAKIGRIARARG
jgi:hypothetical protein